jgi:hypothetical protein
MVKEMALNSRVIAPARRISEALRNVIVTISSRHTVQSVPCRI